MKKYQLVISTPHAGTYAKTYELEDETQSESISKFIGEVLSGDDAALVVENPLGGPGRLIIPREVLMKSVIFIKELTNVS